MDLNEFLSGLTLDPKALAAALRDPKRALDEAGLDEASRAALRSRSPQALWDVLQKREPQPIAPAAPLPPEVQEGLEGRRGSLVVIGTGIRTVGHMTVESLAWLSVADAVLYLVADPVAETLIRQLHPEAVSLRGHYGEGVNRSESYEAMVEQIMGSVRAGKRTVAAFYGHPGVFAFPSHESVRRSRREGYLAFMLPGISAEDCLFADLNVDPAVNGCQSYEATDFLIHDRAADVTSQLVLWQVGVVGDWTYRGAGYDLKAFPMLVARLQSLYGQWHEVTLYEAPIFPGVSPVITKIALGHLTSAYVNAGTTMYVPPARAPTVNPAVAAAMGR
jgi:tetrapyrrole (corrin/porphyrin) methylase-like protein